MTTGIAQVDALVAQLKEMLPMKPEHKKRLDNKFRLEFNYNSNHIEGNTLTYGETELLLIFDDTRGNHSMREYEEMKAHDVAYHMVEDWAKDKERPLTEQNIKNINEIILVRPFWKDAITQDGQATRRQIQVGNYKEYPNSVRLQNGEIFEYTSPADTPIAMQELIDWYRSEEHTLHPVILAAMLHYKFVRIHPFDDGNGRVSRLLMNYVLLRNGLPPVVIKSDDKKNYLRALNRADTGDYEAFIEYIAQQVVWSLKVTIQAAKGQSVDEPDDLDKKLKLLELELNDTDSEEVKMKYSKETFFYCYDAWVQKLISIAIPVIQKFNKLFIGTRHSIHINPSGVHVDFNNEPFDSVIEKLTAAILIEKDKIANSYERIAIQTFYGTFKKGGLQTFGCNYSIVINMDEVKYEVIVDTFNDETGGRVPLKKYEKLFHQVLSDNEMNEVVETFGETIYQHIDYNTKQRGLRK